MSVFLTCCAFIEPEHFGAEVLAPLGPADAAARDVPHAQVHALDVRAVHEDLELRAAARAGPGSCAGSSLKGRSGLGARPRRAGRSWCAASPAISVRKPRRMRSSSRLADAHRARYGSARSMLSARRCVAARSLRARVEAPLEQPQQVARDVRMRVQHALHVGLAEGHTGLQQVAAVGAQHHDLRARQAGREQQAVESVVLDAPRQTAAKASLKLASTRVDLDGAGGRGARARSPGSRRRRLRARRARTAARR